MRIYRVGEFASILGCSKSALRLWDKNGKLPSKRNSAGQRYYDDTDLNKFLNIKTTIERKVVCYSRVSSQAQREDLTNQIKALETFCLNKGIAVDNWISEVGGGMNFKRPKFLEITQEISLGKISKLVIAHKDRLVRFGFDYFKDLADKHDCELIVVNQESLSPQQEMVEDLMAIVHTFSCRLYGLRNYKKDLKKVLNANT